MYKRQLLFVERVGSDEEMLTFSQSFSCPDCGVSIDEIEPRSFSFNNPFGACPECYGLGYKMEFDSDLMIPDRTLSINQGAITVLGWQSCQQPGSFAKMCIRDRYRIGGRLRSGDASCRRADVGIPPLQYWISNQLP